MRKRRDPRKISEDALHESIVTFVDLCGHRNLLRHHPCNEGKRTPAEAERLRKLGMVKGIADLCFTLPDGRTAYMEIKTPNGKLSIEQGAFRLQCELLRIPYAICRSVKDAERTLASWGALRAAPIARAA